MYVFNAYIEKIPNYLSNYNKNLFFKPLMGLELFVFVTFNTRDIFHDN